MELMDYLRIARKYWRSIVVIVLLTVIGVGLFSLLSKRTYTATTSIVLSVVSVANTAGELNASSTYAQDEVKSLALVATAPIVLQPVIDSLGLDTTPENLAKNVTATVPVSTAVINLAVVNGDPAQAARIANALGEQIIAAVKQLSPPSGNGGQTVVATIIRPAVAPTSPTTPKTVQNIELGLLIGLVLAAGQALLRNALNRSVRTEHDIERVTDPAVTGSIMLDPSPEEGPLAAVADARSLRVES